VTKKVTTRHKRMQSYTRVQTRTVPIEGAAALKKRLQHLLKEPDSRAYRWEDIGKNLLRVGELEVGKNPSTNRKIERLTQD